MAAAHRILTSRVQERLLRLPAPVTRDVRVERDLPVPMPDGVVLLADRYVGVDDNHDPTTLVAPPTVLVRTPYGRTGAWALLYGPPLAERGFQVIIQSVRGTSGSGGSFVPRQHERDDGLATVRWIREQPWFGDRLAGAGLSYLGYALWAIADEAGLDAVCVQATMPSLAEPLYDGGSFALGIALPWTTLISQVRPRFGRLRNRFPNKELQAGLNTLPLADGDQATLGRRVGFYQDWLVHGPDDDYWTAQSHTHRVSAVTAPVSMRTGWYDVYLPWMLRDYATLCEAGNRPRLTIGPWAHLSPGLLRGIPRETITFLGEHLLGDPPRAGGQVRFHVTGAGEWRDADCWPPPGGHDQVWSLGAAGDLTPVAAPGAERRTGVGHAPGFGAGGGFTPVNGFGPGFSRHDGPGDALHHPPAPAPTGSASVFRYDPDDPTPAVGGPTMLTDETSVDNRELEQRSDVLVFTSLPLFADLDVIGTPRARLTVSADNRHHDVFVRLCDMHPDGTSKNLSGRLIRLDDVNPGPDGIRVASLDLWPLAHRFAAGHRLRLQVSGGAHPWYTRNPGTGDPIATATRTQPTVIAVHHDDNHPSVLALPVAD